MLLHLFKNVTRTALLIAVLFSISGLSAATYTPQASNRVNINLDTGWLFANTDNAAFSGKTADESSFKAVCLPHNNVVMKHAYESDASFKIITWYRRHFTPPSSQSGRRFLLEFQAVAIVATVYVNGVQVGVHQGAYTPFTLDITSNVTVGADNVIAVKVDSKDHTEIPPAGSGNMDFMIFGGIVRNVNMYVTDPLHVDWIFASTTNPSQTAPTNPTVNVKTKIVNNSSTDKSCTVVTNIVDVNNNVVATASTPQSVPANGTATVAQTTSAISSPNLWHPDNPYLYSVYTQVQDGATYVDEFKTRIGIRSLTMSKTDGKCYINGQAFKLRGLNRHETFPYIGRAASRRLQRKDADILKFDMGCNIVRTSHYPQSPDFLDRCDEVGLLVLEEIPGWSYLGEGNWKTLEMQFLVSMVMRDRNHPALMTWGCRVNESRDDVWYKSTNDSARFYDPTRLTCGVRNGAGQDVAYYYEDIWTRNFLTPSANPTKVPVITSEDVGHGYPIHSFSVEDSLNNEWKLHADAHNSSYGQPIWGGLLGWCAFDYASAHPNAVTLTGGTYVSDHGQADIFRIPKFAGYFYQSQRNAALYGPMIRILNYWKSNSPMGTISVVSNCDQVELFVNGVSKGKKAPADYPNLPSKVASFSGISYSAGSLKADGYIGGVLKATQTWHTPGSPTKIVLIPDATTLSEGGDMTRVVVMAQDANDQYVPYDKTSVTLAVTGAGDFLGESPIALEDGKTCFFVKTRASTIGTITCTATANGLTGGAAAISVVKGDVAVVERPISTAPRAVAMQKSIFKMTLGNRINLPAWANSGAEVSVYNVAGKLVYKTATTAKAIDLEKVGMSKGIYMVKFTGNSPVK